MAAEGRAAERGRAVITGHRYEILTLVADGDRVAVELAWSGTLPAGSVMRGRFASFLEFRAGRIVSQRSYDCFDPW